MCTLTKEKLYIANLWEMKGRIANLDDFHSSIDSGKFFLRKVLLEVVQMQYCEYVLDNEQFTGFLYGTYILK